MDRRPLFTAMLVGSIIGAVVFSAVPLSADTLDALYEPSLISNGTSQNALSIVQKGDVGSSRSESGALFVENSANDHTGLTVYTNAGESAVQPLMRLEVDNPEWNEEILYIHSDSPTSRGLIRLDSPAPEIEFVETDQDGGGKGKFELRVQHNEFQINSRRSDDTTFENKISMTQEGDLVLEKGTLNVKGAEAATFSGGLNITGGCIAIDGECVISSANDLDQISASASQVEEDDEERHSDAQTFLPKAALSEGEPDSIGCNSYTERGAMVLDHENDRLYVCNGPENGWDYTTLSN